MRAALRLTLTTATALTAAFAVPATAQATWYSGPSGVKEVHGAIEGEWLSIGGAASAVGAPVTNELPTSRRPGAYNHFQNGSIYWSPSTGAHEVHGGIRGEWAATGWETGSLGFPASDETRTPDGAGRYNRFQGGSVYWSPGSGAHSIRGGIGGAWAAQGWEQGGLGYPTTDEFSGGGGGAGQHFQNGSIYWSAGTGAHIVKGAIRGTWSSMGWERSTLGYPTSDEMATGDGVRQTFQGGAVSWNASTGAVTVSAPAIRGTSAIPGSADLGGFVLDVTSMRRVSPPSSTSAGYRSGDVPVEIDMTIRNTTSEFWTPNGITEVTSNGTEASQVFSSADGYGGFGYAPLAPGQSRSARFLFSVPPASLGDILVQETVYDAAYDDFSAKFSGRV